MSISDWKIPAHNVAPTAGTDWSKIYPIPGRDDASAQPQAPQAAAAPSGPEPDYANMPAGEVASRAISAAPGSLLRAGEGLYNVVRHPIDTLYNVGKLETGAIGNAANALGYHGFDDPEAQAAASALGQSYADRYGSMAGFKKAVATDPVSVGMDVASIAPGIGAAGKLAGIEKVTGPISKAVSMADPIQAAGKIASVPLGIGKAATRFAVSKASGVPVEALNTAEEAGRSADAAARGAFTGAMKSGDESKIVEQAENALNELGKNASDTYVSQRSNLSTKPLSTQPVIDTIDNAIQSLGKDAAIHHPDTLSLLNNMKSVVQGTTDTTAVGLNNLKIALGNMISDYGRPSMRGLLGQAPSSVVDVIKAEDPSYAKMLSDWGAWKDQLNDIKKTLGIGSNRSSMAKLSAMMKSLSGGIRENLMGQLADTPSGKNLRQMIAGQHVSQWGPQSGNLWQDAISSGAIFALTGGHPISFAPFLLSSPRAAGNAAYLTGAAERYAGNLVPPAPVRGIMARVGQMPYTEDRTQRKSGGRVGDHEAAADQLVLAAERAKKGLSKQTEPLLNQSDDAVAHALEVANRSI